MTPEAEVASLFDHLVRASEQCGWDFQAKRLGCLKIDHQFELGRLDHWKVTGFIPLENASDIKTSLPIRSSAVGAITY
jgi:hypothetical protein